MGPYRGSHDILDEESLRPHFGQFGYDLVGLGLTATNIPQVEGIEARGSLSLGSWNYKIRINPTPPHSNPISIPSPISTKIYSIHEHTGGKDSQGITYGT